MVDVEMRAQQPDTEAKAVFNKANWPVTLKFEDVVYKVKTKNGGSVEKLILKGITGVVFPGEMLAMLGPSGCGKTTLLTALGGRLGGDLSGSITYNNRPYSKSMKRNTGFVTQDDILYPHLTVTETLVYTALLRLPSDLTKQEKVNHAEAVISQLGLSRCRDSIIGGPFLRGISGGERKRVSIGQEMLINPSLLFLDEPTSGLDSTTSQRIVSTLWELAKGGRTIVMTIHQPSSRLFYMFHKVLLLSDGYPLYFGKGSSTLDYFSSIGFVPLLAMNPADFLLDLANGISTEDSQEDQASVRQTLVQAYQVTLSDAVKSQVISDNNQIHDSTPDKKVKQWSNSWWQQFSVLFVRGLKERRHEYLSRLKIAQTLFVSLVCGLLWWKSSESHLQDQVGLLFFESQSWGFYSLFQALFTFPQERLILTKERSSGMYRLSSFFMALILGDLPLGLAFPTVSHTIIYWMAGLKPQLIPFFSSLFVLLYGVLCTEGLGFAVGAMVMHLRSATTLGSVILLTFTLVSGYYVQHVPKFIGWLKYLSSVQYTFKLLVATQFEPGETYPCDTNKTCLVRDLPMIKNMGPPDTAVAVIALGVMLVGYRLIAYLALMRLGVAKR